MHTSTLTPTYCQFGWFSTARFGTVGGSTWRAPTRTQWDHANWAQRSPRPGNKTCDTSVQYLCGGNIFMADRPECLCWTPRWSEPPQVWFTWSAGTLAMLETGREKWSTVCHSGRGLHKCHRNTEDLTEVSRRCSVSVLRTRCFLFTWHLNRN